MQFVDENIHGECDDVLGVDLEPCWWRTFWCLICEAGYINTWVYQHLGSCFKSTKNILETYMVYKMQGNVEVFNYNIDTQWRLGSSHSAHPQILRSCYKIMTMNTCILRLFRAMINNVGDMMQHTAV